MILNYNEVIEFIKKFGIDSINKYDELIIDEATNTFVSISDSNDIEDVKMRVVFALCRPIGKGLNENKSTLLLNKLNNYFDVSLTKDDMRFMYQELCYTSKLEEFKDFIKRGFPIKELRNS